MLTLATFELDEVQVTFSSVFVGLTLAVNWTAVALLPLPIYIVWLVGDTDIFVIGI